MVDHFKVIVLVHTVFEVEVDHFKVIVLVGLDHSNSKSYSSKNQFLCISDDLTTRLLKWTYICWNL